MRRPLQTRVNECGQEGVVVECRCGRRPVPVKCGLRWLCGRCKKRTFARARHRLSKALGARVRASARSDGRPGFQRRPVLVTLTTRHTGDLTSDRERVGESWRKLRQWLHGRARVQAWSKARRQFEDTEETIGQFDYALVWEVTPGRDGLGHVHAHVVALWPRTDWNLLRAEWKRATGDDGAEIDLKRAASRDATEVQSAVNYLAKYTSKGVQVGEFTPELAAQVIDATYGKRLLSTSRGFWLPEPPCACPTCFSSWRVVERPGARRWTQAVWTTHGPQVVLVEDVWRWADGSGSRSVRTVPLEGDGMLWGTRVTRDTSLAKTLTD